MHNEEEEKPFPNIQAKDANQQRKYVKPAMEKVIIPEPEKKDFDSGCTCCTCGCS